MQTPAPRAADATRERQADLRIAADGMLEGTLAVSYTGRDALDWWARFRDEDERGRKDLLTDEIKGWLPEGLEIEITSVSGATPGEEPLHVEARLSHVGLGSKAGRRVLVPIGVLSRGRRTSFLTRSGRTASTSDFPISNPTALRFIRLPVRSFRACRR